jgi:hypothetical protein
MDSIPESAASMLQRHPAPALTVEEVRALLHGGSGAPPASEDILLRELRRRPDLLRILELPPRRWAGAGPRSWILARGPGDGEARRALTGILRASLRHLGERLDPDSALALARWERLIREEGRIRRALSRRRTKPAQGSGP